MKKIKYILIFLLSIGMLNSCLIDDTTDLDDNDQGYNLARFNTYSVNLTALVDNLDQVKNVKMKVAGPSADELTSDITITVEALATSTAVEGEHYRIENPTITLTKANNYVGFFEVIMITAGNKPIEEGEPGYDDYLENYVAPVLDLEVITTTGDANVVEDGKICSVTLNYILFNPYAGLYDTEMLYFHPSAGGSYPPSSDPTDPYGGIRNEEKELISVTSKKCETTFAVWADLAWITVEDDASIVYEVADTWGPDVTLGDPFDPTHVSYFDPATRVIYLYYTYSGTGGNRVFWETFEPKF